MVRDSGDRKNPLRGRYHYLTMRYRVSLAGLVPFNYEMEIEAKDEKEALEKGLIMVDVGNADMPDDQIQWDEARLDIGENPSPETDGVWIEAKKR